MTALRISQMGTINVLGGVSSGLRLSQMFITAVSSNPAAAGLRFSQMFTITVINNNRPIKSIGPTIGLGCWTPCGTLLWNGS